MGSDASAGAIEIVLVYVEKINVELVEVIDRVRLPP